jgi:hypothetical protein
MCLRTLLVGSMHWTIIWQRTAFATAVVGFIQQKNFNGF